MEYPRPLGLEEIVLSTAHMLSSKRPGSIGITRVSERKAWRAGSIPCHAWVATEPHGPSGPGEQHSTADPHPRCVYKVCLGLRAWHIRSRVECSRAWGNVEAIMTSDIMLKFIGDM